MKQLITWCSISLVLAYSNICIAKPVTIDIKVTGFNKSISLDAELKIYPGSDFAADTKRLVNNNRDDNGHFVLEDHRFGYEVDKVSNIYVIGKLKDTGGKVKGYIPLTILHKSDLNSRGYAKLTIPSYTSKEKAFSNSYPFSFGFNQGFINEDNLEKVLFSTRLLMESSYVDGDSWQVLFNSFLQNIQFFKSHNHYIKRVFKYLNTYSSLATNQEYFKFYAETLVRLDGLGVDGTDVSPGESLSQRIQKEWESLIIDHSAAVVPMVRSMIEVLYSEKRYLECVKFSGLAFKKFQTQEVSEKLDNTEFRNYILSAMQGGTQCFQLDFADRADDGSKIDVKAATKFEREDNETRDEVNNFIDLFFLLEKRGYMPRRPRELPSTEASRIIEISRYFWHFTSQ